MENREKIIKKIENLEIESSVTEIVIQQVEEEIKIENILHPQELFRKGLKNDYVIWLINKKEKLEKKQDKIGQELTLNYAKEILYKK